ncbi:MAG: hypothetical protein JXA92_05090 [candidate division Zixibacteria bacterium]|nr:hypothetical protein [candidate division Zixibacteria bacterium]
MQFQIKFTAPVLIGMVLICGFLFPGAKTNGESRPFDPSARPLLRKDSTIGERFRVLGDLNCDGREDMVLSDDIADFAQMGIKLFLYLQDTAGNYILYDSIFAKPGSLAVENYWKGPRLWTYVRKNAQSGILSCSEISDSGLTDWHSMVIYPGDGGTDIGNGILKAVFDNSDSRLEIQKSQTEGDRVNWLPYR